jgi:hypothetical protein
MRPGLYEARNQSIDDGINGLAIYQEGDPLNRRSMDGGVVVRTPRALSHSLSNWGETLAQPSTQDTDLEPMARDRLGGVGAAGTRGTPPLFHR